MIRLTPMDETEAEGFLARSGSNYAESLVRAGIASSKERALARLPPLDQMLPQGVKTPGMFFWRIEDEQTGERVGALWFAVRDQHGDRDGFVYDVVVDASHRGKGYGRAAFLALEEEARKLGLPRVSLNVMAYNTTARTLYETLGYRAVSIDMVKELE